MRRHREQRIDKKHTWRRYRRFLGRYTARILIRSFLFISHDRITRRAYVIQRFPPKTTMTRCGVVQTTSRVNTRGGRKGEKRERKEESVDFRRKELNDSMYGRDGGEGREEDAASACSSSLSSKVLPASSFSPLEICLMRKVNRTVTVAVRATESSKRALPNRRRRASSNRVYSRRGYGHFPPSPSRSGRKNPPFGRPCAAALFPRSCLESVRAYTDNGPMLPEDFSQRFIRQSASYVSRTCKSTLTHITVFF